MEEPKANQIVPLGIAKDERERKEPIEVPWVPIEYSIQSGNGGASNDENHEGNDGVNNDNNPENGESDKVDNDHDKPADNDDTDDVAEGVFAHLTERANQFSEQAGQMISDAISKIKLYKREKITKEEMIEEILIVGFQRPIIIETVNPAFCSNSQMNVKAVLQADDTDLTATHLVMRLILESQFAESLSQTGLSFTESFMSKIMRINQMELHERAKQNDTFMANWGLLTQLYVKNQIHPVVSVIGQLFTIAQEIKQEAAQYQYRN